MKFSPTLLHTETFYVRDYTHMVTGYWCCERRGYFTCKARRAILIKFSRINKLAFVGHAFIGLIFIERLVILSNSLSNNACQALFGI